MYYYILHNTTVVVLSVVSCLRKTRCDGMVVPKTSEIDNLSSEAPKEIPVHLRASNDHLCDTEPLLRSGFNWEKIVRCLYCF